MTQLSLNNEQITITLSNLKSGKPSISISTPSERSNETPLLSQKQQTGVKLSNPKKRSRKLVDNGIIDLTDVTVKQEVRPRKKPRGRPRKDGLPPGSVVDLTI